MSDITEGYATFSHPTLEEPTRTWYQIHGELTSSTHPLIILHGGPGATHTYLTDMAYFHTHHKRTVIFYDQIGCGNSTRLPHRRLDTKFWVPQLFMDELDNLIAHLKIKSFDILGQSWGGMLGAQYAIAKSSDSSHGLKRLVISNSPASMELWLKSCNEWRTELPRDIDETLEKYEKLQEYTNPEYEAAVIEFYKRHMCRVPNKNGVDPFPDPLMKMMALLEEDNTVYFTMNGPSEFTVIGSLKEWSLIGQLHVVKKPTLVIAAEFDEGKKFAVEPYAKEIPGSKLIVVEGASHCTHIEKTEEYCKLVTDWMAEHE